MRDPYEQMYPEDALAWKRLFALGGRVLPRHESFASLEIPAELYLHALRTAEIRLFAVDKTWDYFPEIGGTAFFRTKAEWERFRVQWIDPVAPAWRALLTLLPAPTEHEASWWKKAERDERTPANKGLSVGAPVAAEPEPMKPAPESAPVPVPAKPAPVPAKPSRADPCPERTEDHTVWQFLLRKVDEPRLASVWGLRRAGAKIVREGNRVRLVGGEDGDPVCLWVVETAARLLNLS